MHLCRWGALGRRVGDRIRDICNFTITTSNPFNRSQTILGKSRAEHGIRTSRAVLMQSETAINTEAPASQAAELGKLGSEPRWRTVDRTLRTIAARRAALDAEEVRWLREAEALQIWRE